MSGCNICPRNCNVDRNNNEYGVCGVPSEIHIARAMLHMWEEPCISGNSGSGAVFFYGCPLRCIYCQNFKISHGIDKTKAVSADELANVFIELQEMGANNINLVTPTHYSLEIITAVGKAKNKGLNIPIVYNCSGYESVDTLKKLHGYVDIYLTDFKYMNDDLGVKYSKVSNYSEVAKNALAEMVRQVGAPEFLDNGIMKKGVIVRNLLLPSHVNNSKAVLQYIYETYGDLVYISIMNQYTPLEQVKNIKELNRKVTKREYNRLIDYAISLGIKNAFIQEGDVAKESFIPDF
ncbi:MAG: radical SAM protein [Lachnospiraceae bacterium]|nr:radical SAM protein [Lachnospiraceae bacterium]